METALSPALVFILSVLFQTVSLGQTEPCNNTPDFIFYNGKVITMDTSNPFVEAIAIKSDSIMAISSDEEILDLIEQGCGAKVIDLFGLIILPGFNDSHSHWLSWREHICSVTSDTTYPSLEEIMQMLSSFGWTSISELNFGRPDVAPEHFNNAMALDAQGELSVRLNGYWGTLDDGSLITVLSDSNRTPNSFYSNRVRAPGVKMYVDNPFGTSDLLTQAQVTNLVQLAHNAGWQIAAHCVNTSAVEKIITAYENVLGSSSNENYRHRIEHAVKVSDTQLNRMSQKGFIASFQLMGSPDWPEQSTFQTYISNTNPEWCLRWKDFVEAESLGLHNTGSTDAPFNDAPCDYSPFRVIYQAVTRKGYLIRTPASWELAQRLTIENSLKLLTTDGAYATFEENKKGSLTPGKWADLVIVSDNPLTVSDPENLLEIENYYTMIGGETEYCSDIANSDLCTSVETFRLDSALVSASNYLPDQTPNLAFDNNPETNWGAEDFAPQYIQVDLMDELNITSIELLIDQWPAGHTVHQIWGKRNNPTASFTLIHEFSGNTSIGQTLSYAFPSGSKYRYLKILTTESPSWVSWKEVKIYKEGIVSVDDNNKINSFSLEQNFPNPFNPSTVIKYSVPKESYVKLTLYDALGKEVRIIINEIKNAGTYEQHFDATGLSNGVYYYRIEVQTMEGKNYSSARKMMLVK